MKLRGQNALRTEVHEFSENIRSKVERGMKGQELDQWQMHSLIKKLLYR